MFIDDEFFYIIGNPKTLCVVDQFGQLSIMSAPFPLTCLHDVGELKANSIVYADEVISTPTGGLVFLIGCCAYHLRHFNIPTPF